MDVITMEKTGENYRLLFDTKGRFVLHRVSAEEAKFKLLKVKTISTGSKASIGRNPFHTGQAGTIPYLTTHDGRVGVILNREKHPGSFEIVHLKDKRGVVFATRSDNVFAIGEGVKPWISLPRGKGIKLSIQEAKEKLE